MRMIFLRMLRLRRGFDFVKLVEKLTDVEGLN